MPSKKTQETETSSSAVPNVRVVFMGTPLFAETILSSLVEAKYDVVAVYTKPDRPTGRKQEISKSVVKVFAEAHTLPVEQPEKFNNEAKEQLQSYQPDVVIVAAYGRILPEEVLRIPKYGCVNVHASLLPRWRGASPIQNALLAGDSETGVTIMRMDTGVDTGDILSTRATAIKADDTTEMLSSRLASEGALLLIETLPKWIQKTVEPIAQDESKVTLCQLIDREDGRIFWNEDAETIYNRYRALTPWPGVFTFWKREGFPLRIKLSAVSCQKVDPEAKHALGEVCEVGDKIGVKTGRGMLFFDTVHLEGKTPQPTTEFVRGYPDFIGAILE